MITKKQVAEYAGVSTATVSRVVNGVGYVSRDTETKVRHAIEALKYIPNKLAGNLARNRSNLIAVLVEDLINPYYMTLVDAMVERASQDNYVVSVFAIKNRDVHRVLEDLAANRVCGIVNLAMFTCDFSCYDVFLEAGTRLINCTADSSVVSIDYTTGIEEAMRYLAENGRKHVAFISGLEEWLSHKDMRVKYFREHRTRFGFDERDDTVLSADYPMSRAYDVGYALMNEIFDTAAEVDAVICLTDMMALGAMKSCYDHGRRIPEDVSFIGCDNLDFTPYFQPALTTVNVDKRAEGFAYIDYVLGKTDGVTLLPTHLTVRESVCRK